jgi:hypothetical protein
MRLLPSWRWPVTRARCGKVDSLSAFSSGSGEQLITIDGKTYATVIEARFPVRAGDIVEHRPAGSHTTITAVQTMLISEPESENLFSGCIQ